jgi:hypothetical protein
VRDHSGQVRADVRLQNGFALPIYRGLNGISLSSDIKQLKNTFKLYPTTKYYSISSSDIEAAQVFSVDKDIEKKKKKKGQKSSLFLITKDYYE